MTYIYMIKKTFNINEKNKDLGLLKKVQKQERLRGDFWYGNHFGKVGSYSVQGMNIRFQCLILHP